MIKVENDYEPVIYEQPFSSHIYENQSELLHNYYIKPVHSTPTTQKTNEINTTNQPNENEKTKCLNTNHIYQNIQKEQPKEKIWTIPFLLESPRSKEFQPPDLEIDFLIDSGAESNIINIPTWNEIKTLHPKLTPLETSSKLATAQGSTLINYGKIQLFLLPTRTMEQNKILNKPFKQIFHITDIKHNIIGIPFISKYIPTINILNSKILIKDKYTKTKDTALTFFQRLNKQPPFFSKFYPIYNQQRKHLKPLSGNIYNFSIKQVHQYDKKQNKQKFYMSDFEFKPIHKFFKITISSIKYLKNSNSDIIFLHVYNNTPYQVTLPLGLLGYCETNATISPIHEKAYRVNNILQLLDICQSTILNEELSINNIISNEKRNTDYFTKTPYFKPTFNINNYTENQQKFLTMFNFQHSQITQDEFEKLAKQLIKYSSVYATSKFDVGKISSSLHLPLKPDAVFKKQRASKVAIHLHDKVNRLLDILEQYNIISPVNKEEQPKDNTFINPVIILAKGESLKIVLDARYLNSLIDESKCNWPIEPIQVILTKINGKYFTTADMNSAYNQMPLDEQSRRLTQFVIGNQQYEFNRLFYGISIGPAAFSAFMSKIFRPLILKKNAITYLDDVFMQSQTKEEMFNVLEQYHQILQNENLKAAPDKSHFFLTRVKFLGHNIERKTITPLKSRIDAIQKLQPPTNKKKIQEFLGMLNFLSKYVYKMQLYLRPFYNILRQQNNFEWNTEHQARFEEIKKLLTEQISNTIPDSNQPFYAMCDASNFGIGAALLQSHNGTNKMNLISANSRLFTQAELRLSTLMRECTAIIYTLTEYEFLILGSKHPTVLFTDHTPIIFLFTQKSNPNHRVYRFQLILMKFPNLHIVWTAGKNLALPDTLSRNTPPELHTHDEDHFHHPQILKLASGTHTEWMLNRDKKHNEIYQKVTKKLLQRQNINEQINSRFTPASDLKIGTFVLIPNFNTQKGISKKLQPLRKGPYQIITKPTDVTYKITDSDKKEIVQHRNNLLPYYPKEYALRELTQLYSFTGLKVIQNDPHTENTTKEQNDIHLGNQNTKSTTTKNNTKNLDQNTSQKERKNRKMTEQIIPQEQIDKSEHRESSRLRNQPRKNYKLFIPQSKILKKVEFQKQL